MPNRLRLITLKPSSYEVSHHGKNYTRGSRSPASKGSARSPGVFRWLPLRKSFFFPLLSLTLQLIISKMCEKKRTKFQIWSSLIQIFLAIIFSLWSRGWGYFFFLAMAGQNFWGLAPPAVQGARHNPQIVSGGGQYAQKDDLHKTVGLMLFYFFINYKRKLKYV